MSYGVGHWCGSDLALLWLWWRLAATALIRPSAWELPYAAVTALKRKKENIYNFWGVEFDNFNKTTYVFTFWLSNLMSRNLLWRYTSKSIKNIYMQKVTQHSMACDCTLWKCKKSLNKVFSFPCNGALRSQKNIWCLWTTVVKMKKAKYKRTCACNAILRCQ